MPLTTRQRIKDMLRITTASRDAFLDQLVVGVSGLIGELTNRVFDAADYWTYFNGHCTQTLVLKNRPVSRLYGVWCGQSSAISTETGGFVTATVSVTSTGVLCYTLATDGTATNTALAFSDYPTLDLMAAAITALTGWTATRVCTYDEPAMYLVPMGGSTCTRTTSYLKHPSKSCEVVFNADTGIVNLSGFGQAGWPTEGTPAFPGGFRNLVAFYRGGYESGALPEALIQLATETVAAVYQRAGTSPSLSEERLGSYAYKLLAEAPFRAGLRDRLDPFMDIPFGSG